MARADEGGPALWPWLLAGGGATAAAIWWARGSAAETSIVSAAPELVTARWVFPVPMWGERKAEISDGYSAEAILAGPDKHRKHLGVDIMFRRRSRAELVTEYPPDSPDGSRGYFMPRAHPAVAAADGVVWSAKRTARGFSVVVSHGAPWATYYQHLEALYVEPTTRGASGERVRAGQPLGPIGGNPSQPPHLRHLHFALWRGGDNTHAIDPAPFLRRWAHLPQPARSVRAEA